MTKIFYFLILFFGQILPTVLFTLYLIWWLSSFTRQMFEICISNTAGTHHNVICTNHLLIYEIKCYVFTQTLCSHNCCNKRVLYHGHRLHWRIFIFLKSECLWENNFNLTTPLNSWQQNKKNICFEKYVHKCKLKENTKTKVNGIQWLWYWWT